MAARLAASLRQLAGDCPKVQFLAEVAEARMTCPCALVSRVGLSAASCGVILRCSLQPFFDKTWKPGEIEDVI